MLQDNADDRISNKFFLCEDRFSNRPLGLAIISKIDWKNRHAECAYIIGDSDYRGKLVGGDLAVTLYHYCFNNLNLHKVYGFVIDSNSASIRLNEFGGSYDGTLYNHRFSSGEYASDVRVYSITRKEFSHFVQTYAKTLLRRHIAKGLL